MTRVCFAMVSLALLSACAAEQDMPSANLRQESLLSRAKNVVACTGLPIEGRKCALEEQNEETAPKPGNDKV
jgi:hypothetical protein